MAAPAWRQAFDAWEKALGPTLADTAASTGFRDVMATTTKLTSSVVNELERSSRQWLHLWNLPAASDVRSLRRQIRSLDDEVASLRRSLDSALEELATHRATTNGTVQKTAAANGTTRKTPQRTTRTTTKPRTHTTTKTTAKPKARS